MEDPMIKLDLHSAVAPGQVPADNAERVLHALRHELGAVEIPTDDPRFQELLQKRADGNLSFGERDELNEFIRVATESVS